MIMNSVRIYFKVGDYSKWKKYFDEDKKSGLFEKAGVTFYALHRLVGSPNEPSLYFEFKDLNLFKDFSQSEAMKTRIKDSGVIGDPTYEFLDNLEESPVGAEKAA
jgi:hypothetical protein